MVQVTRFDGSQLYLNAELIESVEATPDTVISLTTHHKVLVREATQEVVERVIAYRQRVHGGPLLRPVPSGSAQDAP